jgi:hypothetical protein
MTLQDDVQHLIDQMQEIEDSKGESGEVKGLAYHVKESLQNALDASEYNSRTIGED